MKNAFSRSGFTSGYLDGKIDGTMFGVRSEADAELTRGFGGQKFMPSALDKLRWLRAEREKRAAHYLLEVDGGVDARTAPLCAEAGADILVAGSAVFGAADPADAVRQLAAL